MGSGRILIIQSVSEDGRQFRPSDWIERISGTLGSFGSDNRLHYSNQVQPRMINGEKCLVVDPLLQEQNPQAFEYIMAFVRANKLKVREEQE
ncbi:MAG: DUF3579 domain-containing protein [Gammaproteobacteria bacterium]|nr:DUF3579 domain-containing protein [Gammaproteobacteria bacterium]